MSLEPSSGEVAAPAFPRDLADLYGVETWTLVQAVARNGARFPDDFAFRLTEGENRILRSQIVTSRSSWGGRRYPPYAFTVIRA